MVNFPTGISDCDSHSPALLDLFISSEANICSIVAFPPLGNSDHVVASVSFDFPPMSLFIAQLMNILALIRTVFVIIWEMFHGSISLNSVLLLLVLNSVSSSGLELMSLNENVRSSLIHLHSSHLLLNLNSGRLVIVWTWFLKLLNLLVMMNMMMTDSWKVSSVFAVFNVW